MLRSAPYGCAPENGFAPLFRDTGEVFHRGDYNVPRGFSEPVGKFRDLFDQIIGKAKDLSMF